MTLDFRIFYNTHLNEELGPAFAQLAEAAPIGGVELRDAHPEGEVLADDGQRFLGETQLQARYPGRPDGDPEERAAYANMLWLNGAVANPHVLVYDIHNNHTPGLDFMSAGYRIPKAVAAGALLLGFDRYVVESGIAFYETVPNGCALEVGIPDGDYESPAKLLHERMALVATKSAVELEAEYGSLSSSLSFYEKFSPPTANKRGELAEYIPGLEEIPAQPAFSPLELPADLRRMLGLPMRASLFFGSWGHDNMSHEAPQLGEFNGRPRTEFFGDVFMAIDPPREEGLWLEFDGLAEQRIPA